MLTRLVMITQALGQRVSSIRERTLPQADSSHLQVGRDLNPGDKVPRRLIYPSFGKSLHFSTVYI